MLEIKPKPSILTAMKRLIALSLLAVLPACAQDQTKTASEAAPPDKTAAASASKAPVKGPEITFEETRHNFGAAEPGTFNHTFKFKNTGTETLEIKNVQAGCGCTVIQTYEKKIEPGQEGGIPVALNAGTMKGHVEKGVTVTSNDAQKPTVVLTVIADLKVDLSVTPQSIWLGRLQPESETNQTIEVKSALAEPLEIEKVETTVPWLEAKLISSTTNSAKIEVSTKPPLPYGNNRTVINVHTKYAKYSNVTVNASIQVPATISAVPTSLIFEKGTQRTQTLMVMRNDGKEFHITDVKPNSPLITSVLATNQPGRAYRVTVNYAPANGKDVADGKIEILTDEPTWPKVEVPYQFREVK
jgi:hypothetical protein